MAKHGKTPVSTGCVTALTSNLISKQENSLKTDFFEVAKSSSQNFNNRVVETIKLKEKRNTADMQTINPKDQKGLILTGSPFLLKVGSKQAKIKPVIKTVYLDGKAVQAGSLPENFVIISTSSESGKELLYKTKHAKGSYISNGIKFEYEVMEIFPYSWAKKNFFSHIK